MDLFNKCFDVKVPYEETSFLILSIVSTNKEKGLGSFLLEYVKNYTIENKIFNIGLYVRISNITAINTYLKNNYKILGYASGQYYMEQNNSKKDKMQIPFHKTHTTDEEINAVVDSIKSGWLTMGPKTIEFGRKI